MTSKLNPNAQLWVAALRSGEYKQGKDFLHNEDTNSFCCLGVACDLFLKAGNTMECDSVIKKGYYSKFSRVTRYADKEDVLPMQVMNWVRLADNTGSTKHGDSLTQLNDGSEKTFAEIADIIESMPEGLFVEGGQK